MDCSLPGSSVHGILQARILEWVPFPFSGDLPDLGVKPASLASPALAGGFFTIAPPGKQIFMANFWLIFSVSLWPADKWKSKEWNLLDLETTHFSHLCFCFYLGKWAFWCIPTVNDGKMHWHSWKHILKVKHHTCLQKI